MTYDGQSETDKNRYKTLDLDYIKNRWDKRADRWDNDLSDDKCHLNRADSYQRFLTILDSIVNDIQNKERKIFLDLGCGTGALLEKYSTLFMKSYGVDISDRMLLKAKEKQLISIELIQANCFQYFDSLKTYDLIASRGVLLSHYGEINSINLLACIHSALTENGILFIDALNKENDFNPIEKTLYTEEQLYSMFRMAGFSNVKLYTEKKYPLIYIKAQK